MSHFRSNTTRANSNIIENLNSQERWQHARHTRENIMSKFNHFREARNRGGQYLLDQLGADGAFPASAPDVCEYYKVITAFQVIGRDDAAGMICDWIRQQGMTPDGHFGPRPDGVPEHVHAYLNAWIVCGAHRLGQFDLSLPGMKLLLDCWDSESGGFYASLTQRDAETNQELMGTCMCGLAALYTGMTDVACGVGGWLRTVMAAQPDFPRALYTVYTRSGGLCTEPPGEGGHRYVVYSDAERDQDFFNPGIAGGFLCRLYQATGEPEWLALAQQYMRFAEVASDYLFHIVRAGKVGWATSLLCTLTQEQKYRDMAVRVGNNLVQLQSAEGFWSGVGETTPSNDSTAERVVWMDEIYQAVNGH